MKKAFTLIELLVVISIIALLIAILLPVLSSARQSAIDVQCASNQKQLSAAAHVFATDSKGKFMRTSRQYNVGTVQYLPNRAEESVGTDHISWVNLDVRDYYTDDIGVDFFSFGCPNRGDSYVRSENQMFRLGYYLMFGRLMSTYPAPTTALGNWDSPQTLEDPSDLVMTGDLIEFRTRSTDYGMNVSSVSHAPKGERWGKPNGLETPEQLDSRGGNQSFMDGSVSWVAQNDMTEKAVNRNGFTRGYFRAPESRRR